MRSVVIGGRGLVGSRLVERLRGEGHEAVVVSRSFGIDIVTGEGLRDAMDGAQVIIDVSNPSPRDNPLDFFLRAGRNISAVEVAAGATHHLVLSVVGADRLADSDYFRAKVLQEDLVRRSGVPHTIIRSTQFFEFLPHVADFSTEDGIVRLSTALVQPVAADDVADLLALTALHPPANELIEVAGPESFPLSDAVRRILVERHDERLVTGEPDAPYFGVRLDHRSLLPGSDARIGPTRLDSWLPRTPVRNRAL